MLIPYFVLVGIVTEVRWFKCTAEQLRYSILNIGDSVDVNLNIVFRSELALFFLIGSERYVVLHELLSFRYGFLGILGAAVI